MVAERLQPSKSIPAPGSQATLQAEVEASTMKWAGLLARWTAIAQAAAALPPGDESEAWRASVVPAVGLNALVAACEEAAEWSPDHRAYAADAAAVRLDQHRATLHAAWLGRLPASLVDLLGEAEEAIVVLRGR